MYVGIVAIARSTLYLLGNVKNISSLYLLATWGAIPFSPPHFRRSKRGKWDESYPYK